MKKLSIMTFAILLFSITLKTNASFQMELLAEDKFTGTWVDSESFSGLKITDQQNLISIEGRDWYSSWEALCSVVKNIADCNGKVVMKNGTIYKYSSKLEIIVLDEKNNQTRQIKESWDTDSGVHKNEGTYLYNERKANAPTSAR